MDDEVLTAAPLVAVCIVGRDGATALVPNKETILACAVAFFLQIFMRLKNGERY
jgi:hypothetical protein